MAGCHPVTFTYGDYLQTSSTLQGAMAEGDKRGMGGGGGQVIQPPGLMAHPAVANILMTSADHNGQKNKFVLYEKILDLTL